MRYGFPDKGSGIVVLSSFQWRVGGWVKVVLAFEEDINDRIAIEIYYFIIKIIKLIVTFYYNII